LPHSLLKAEAMDRSQANPAGHSPQHAAADTPFSQSATARPALAAVGPRGAAQQQLAQTLQHSPRVVAQRARMAGMHKPAVALPARPVAQRLIINAGADTLLDEARKPSGWITMKTLDVGLHMDGGGRVVELGQVDPSHTVGTDENIFIVGHGAAGKVAAIDPGVLAVKLKPILPKPWKGFIAGLTCNAGLAAPGASKSGGEQLHDALGGAPVIAARGSTFTHMDIDMAIRVLKDDKNYASDFRRYFFLQIPFTFAEERELLIESLPQRTALFKSKGASDLHELFEKCVGQINTTGAAFQRIITTKDLSKLDERAKESQQIDAAHNDVNKQWLDYMKTGATDLPAMASQATVLSKSFYEVAVAYGDKHQLFHDVNSKEEFQYHET